MKLSGAAAATASLFVLTGFDASKLDTLIANCTAKGTARKQCVCSFKIIEKRVGKDFLEAIYLQVTGRRTAYQHALMHMIRRDPSSPKKVIAAQAEAKRKCSKWALQF